MFQVPGLSWGRIVSLWRRGIRWAAVSMWDERCWGQLKGVRRCKTLGVNAERGLYEGKNVPTALQGVQTLGVRPDEKD